MLAVLIALAASAHAQAPPQSEFRSFGYVRLGYGGIFAGRVQGGPAIGFGFRGESGSFGLDVSGLNYVVGSDLNSDDFVFAGSLIKVLALHMFNADGDRSSYVGLGMSWGGLSASRESPDNVYSSGWNGAGLQGELTVGHELNRNSPLRAFFQADVGLPLFRSRSDVYSYLRPGVPAPRSVENRYTPTVVVSLGVGWDKHRP